MLGDKIKKLRLKEGMTQEELGKKLHVSGAAIAFYENGKRNPNLEMINELAVIFSVSADYLLDTPTVEGPEYDPETLEILEMLGRNEELRMLFKRTGHLSKEDMEQIVRIMKATLPPEYEE